MTRLSGFCSPPDMRHEYGHEACQKHIDNGNVARCDCADYGGHTTPPLPAHTPEEANR